MYSENEHTMSLNSESVMIGMVLLVNASILLVSIRFLNLMYEIGIYSARLDIP